MIICITTWHVDAKTKRKSLVVSHGVDRETGKQITLPTEHPRELGATFNEELREWVIT